MLLRVRSLLGFIFLLVCSVTLNACTKAKPVSSRTSTVGFWWLPWDKPGPLSVCWEFTSPSTASFRQRVYKEISTVFKGTGFTFVGWEACTTKHSDVRLFLYDDAEAAKLPTYKELLKELRSRDDISDGAVGHPRMTDKWKSARHPGKTVVVLNRTFIDSQKDVIRMYDSFKSAGKENLAVSAAIHEFGHVLGLMHEDAHPNSTCSDFKEDLSGGQVATAYNPFSFMSRCYYRLFNYELGIVRPNARDIEGIKKLYAHWKVIEE